MKYKFLFLLSFIFLIFLSNQVSALDGWSYSLPVTLINNNTILYANDSIQSSNHVYELTPTTVYSVTIVKVQTYKYSSTSFRNYRSYFLVNVSNYTADELYNASLYVDTQGVTNYLSTNPVQVYYCNDSYNTSNLTWHNQDSEVINCVFKQNITAWNVDFSIDLTNEIREELASGDKLFTIKFKFFTENSSTSRDVDLVQTGVTKSRVESEYYHQNYTDYQVKYSLNTTQLFEQGKLNSSCEDLRVTWVNDSNGDAEELINFWVVDCNTSNNLSNSTVWIKVPKIRNKYYYNDTIYIYYGNSTEESLSSFNNTIEHPFNMLQFASSVYGDGCGESDGEADYIHNILTDEEGNILVHTRGDDKTHAINKTSFAYQCQIGQHTVGDIGLSGGFGYFVGSDVNNELWESRFYMNNCSQQNAYSLTSADSTSASNIIFNSTGYPLIIENFVDADLSRLHKRNSSKLSTSLSYFNLPERDLYDIEYLNNYLYVVREVATTALNLTKYYENGTVVWSQSPAATPVSTSIIDITTFNNKIAIMSTRLGSSYYLTIYYENGTLLTNYIYLNSSLVTRTSSIKFLNDDMLLITGSNMGSDASVGVYFVNGTLIYNHIYDFGTSDEAAYSIDKDKTNDDNYTWFIAGGKNCNSDSYDQPWFGKVSFFKNSSYQIIQNTSAEQSISTTNIQPTNNQYLNTTTVYVACNTSSANNITNLTLYGDWNGGWHANLTNSTSDRLNLSINQTIVVSSGTYTYSCLGWDVNNNIAWSSNNTFYIDLQIPANVSLISPPNNTQVNSSSIFQCNGSDDLNLHNLLLYTNLTGAWEIKEESIINNLSGSASFSINPANWNAGVYIWSCAACDDNNCNTSFIENRTFTINKSFSIDYIRKNDTTITGNELKNSKFYNNLTLRINTTSIENLTYANFTLVDPNGVIRYFNINGSQTDSFWTSTNSTILNVSGQWKANTTVGGIVEGTQTITEYFNITDVVGYLNAYQHSTTTTEKGGNISYNLTLWQDTDECFNYSFTPWLNYSNNFTIYTQYPNLTVCGGDIYHPYYNLITIYINSSSTDNVYLGNISINRTNTSTLYVSTINLTVNPPTASPYLYDSNNIYQCDNTMDGNCSWEQGGQVGVFYFKDYYVRNLGEYNASNCNLIINTNESIWDYAIDNRNFSLSINESKLIKLSIRALSGYGETKQAYVSITCDNSTPYGYPASTLPENNPIFYLILDELPVSETGGGGGGGGGGGAQAGTSYVCDNQNLSWEAKNERGGSSYGYYLLPNTVSGIREDKIILTNLFKTSDIDITAKCYDGGYVRNNTKYNNSNICDYFTLDKSLVKLTPTSEQQEINFVLNISNSDYKLGDTIYLSVLLSDEYGCSYYFPITIKITSEANILSLGGFFSKFNECKILFGMCISYLIIFILLLIVFSILFMILFIYLKIEKYVLSGILSGLILDIIVFILI